MKPRESDRVRYAEGSFGNVSILYKARVQRAGLGHNVFPLGDLIVLVCSDRAAGLRDLPESSVGDSGQRKTLVNIEHVE